VTFFWDTVYYPYCCSYCSYYYHWC